MGGILMDTKRISLLCLVGLIISIILKVQLLSISIMLVFMCTLLVSKVKECLQERVPGDIIICLMLLGCVVMEGYVLVTSLMI